MTSPLYTLQPRVLDGVLTQGRHLLNKEWDLVSHHSTHCISSSGFPYEQSCALSIHLWLSVLSRAIIRSFPFISKDVFIHLEVLPARTWGRCVTTSTKLRIGMANLLSWHGSGLKYHIPLCRHWLNYHQNQDENQESSLSSGSRQFSSFVPG